LQAHCKFIEIVASDFIGHYELANVFVKRRLTDMLRLEESVLFSSFEFWPS